MKTVPSVRWGEPTDADTAAYHAIMQDGVTVYVHDCYNRSRYLEIILTGGERGGQLVAYCDSRQDSDFCC